MRKEDPATTVMPDAERNLGDPSLKTMSRRMPGQMRLAPKASCLIRLSIRITPLGPAALVYRRIWLIALVSLAIVFSISLIVHEWRGGVAAFTPR